MKILVINTGSSSLKFTLLDMVDQRLIAAGQVERIGLKDTCLSYRDDHGVSERTPLAVRDYTEAVRAVTDRLTHADKGVLTSLDEIYAVGHRLVHAGEKIRGTVVIDNRVKQIMEDCFHLAPLHNPPNLEGVRACEALCPGTPQVGVFDTAFHSTMPPRAYLYGLPYELYREHGIRRYGFHGTSHKYVCRKAAEMAGRPLEDLKIISCHLGNGSSIAAVDRGKSVDTTMGMTPLEGLIMGTRSGDLDPGVILYLLEERGLEPAQVNHILNKKSGMLGLGGIGSSDLRDIEGEAQAGNQQAAQALEAYCYRVKKYIGAYKAAMNGVDLLVFTAGIGENSVLVRQEICRDLASLGIELDESRNTDLNGSQGFINSSQSSVGIMIVPTNEELEIALETLRVLNDESTLSAA